MLNRRSLVAAGLLVLSAFGAAPAQAQTCTGGATIGHVKLPAGGMPGMVQGDLIIGQTGPTVFQLMGVLHEAPSPTTERHGFIQGVLVDGSGTPQFAVRGRWVAGPGGDGRFRCAIRRQHPSGQLGPIVGRINAKFHHGTTGAGPYQGKWGICQ